MHFFPGRISIRLFSPFLALHSPLAVLSQNIPMFRVTYKLLEKAVFPSSFRKLAHFNDNLKASFAYLHVIVQRCKMECRVAVILLLVHHPRSRQFLQKDPHCTEIFRKKYKLFILKK